MTWDLVAVQDLNGKRIRRFYKSDTGRQYVMIDEYRECVRPYTVVRKWHLVDETCLTTVSNINVDYKGPPIYETRYGGEQVDRVILDGLVESGWDG